MIDLLVTNCRNCAGNASKALYAWLLSCKMHDAKRLDRSLIASRISTGLSGDPLADIGGAISQSDSVGFAAGEKADGFLIHES